MKKIDWKKKLSSRKLWGMIAALVLSVLTAFGVPALTAEQVVVIISGIGAIAVYILAEGSVDKAAVGEETQPEQGDTEEEEEE